MHAHVWVGKLLQGGFPPNLLYRGTLIYKERRLAGALYLTITKLWLFPDNNSKLSDCKQPVITLQHQKQK